MARPLGGGAPPRGPARPAVVVLDAAAALPPRASVLVRAAATDGTATLPAPPISSGRPLVLQRRRRRHGHLVRTAAIRGNTGLVGHGPHPRLGGTPTLPNPRTISTREGHRNHRVAPMPHGRPSVAPPVPPRPLRRGTVRAPAPPTRPGSAGSIIAAAPSTSA